MKLKGQGRGNLGGVSSDGEGGGGDRGGVVLDAIRSVLGAVG
jgi:hypothetical protein